MTNATSKFEQASICVADPDGHRCSPDTCGRSAFLPRDGHRIRRNPLGILVSGRRSRVGNFAVDRGNEAGTKDTTCPIQHGVIRNHCQTGAMGSGQWNKYRALRGRNPGRTKPRLH